MKKIISICGVAAAALAATSAQATVGICDGPACVSTDENVLVDALANVSLVTGSTQGGVAVEFTSDELITGGANGQAKVEGADGVLNSLTFTLLDGFSFATAEWNLFALSGNNDAEAISVEVTYFDVVNNLFDTITVNGLSGGGQNFMGISGDAGERFVSLKFVFPEGTGVQDLRQLRLGGVGIIPMVPEPATWALMVAGLGAVGFSLRRRQRRTINFA